MARAVHGDKAAKLRAVQQSSQRRGPASPEPRAPAAGFPAECWLGLQHPRAVGLAACGVCVGAKQHGLGAEKNIC